MQYSNFLKSLLAVAIATAACQAQASTHTLDNKPAVWPSQTFEESLTINGSLETEEDGVELSDGTWLKGDLTLDAQITVNGPQTVLGNFASAVDISGDSWAVGDYVQIDGSVTNKGALAASGLMAQGITVEHASIEKGLINDGSIVISNGVDIADSIKEGNPAGIFIGNANIDGTVRNNGLIKVTGNGDVSGIQILDSDLDEASVENGSDGLIEVSGADAAGIDISESEILALTNAGHISVKADAEKAIGIWLENSDVTQSVVNTGSIEASGPSGGAIANGLEITGTTIGGDLVNAGTIKATSTSTDKGEDAAEGIRLFGTSIAGDLHNSGTIDANGAGSIGIDMGFKTDATKSSSVDGDLVNSGTVKATGSNAKGFLLEAARIAGKLINTGAIQASGDTAKAIKLEDTDLIGGLDNSGSITASGAGSVGILLEGSALGAGLTNSGTIQGDAFGIQLDADNGTTLEIKQTGGLIAGNDHAIQGGTGNHVSLVLQGGEIRGDLAGLESMQVTGNGLFNGNAIQANTLTVSNGGTLTLGADHSALTGNLDLQSGANLALGLSQATDPNRAVLAVSGAARFADGSTLSLAARNKDFSAEGSQYTLVSASSVEDNGLQVVSSSALLNVDLFKVEDDQVLATVTSKSAGEAGEIIGGAGAGSNAQAAFAPFYASVLSTLDNNDPVFQAFANANEAEAAKLAEQLTPQVDGASSQAATGAQNLISSAVGSRTATLRGQSSGEAFSQTGVWIQGLSSSADQGRRDGIAGYDADSKGVSIGIDGKLNPDLTLGLAYSYLTTDVKSANGNKTDVDSQALTLYSGFEQGDLFVDASLTYGVNDNSSKRYIAGTRAKGDYDSTLLGLNVTAGYGLHFDNLTLEPRVAGRYSMVDIDGYSEKGSTAGLRIDSQRYEAIELGAGVRLAALLQAGQGTLEPEVRLMAYHDFAADQASSTSTYILGGTPFATTGAKPARDSYEAGVGLSYRLGAVTIGGSYDYLGKSDFNADVFQAKVRYDF